MITLASGEKTVPTPMEGVIVASPLLQGAVMFGRERNQVGVLVEPRPEYSVNVLDDNAVAAFRNKIWSVFQGFPLCGTTIIRILIVVSQASHRGSKQDCTCIRQDIQGDDRDRRSRTADDQDPKRDRSKEGHDQGL